ncbi:sugar ABC transporter substrate-binding protein [Paenarthrobacter sp. NyZ202]|uniref:sugar ABC transporter substrate-binding protein n=1 Tax=Paenarthrobacter sp. NyZ202 TaxID=3402689 RepID=UPI003CE8D0B9
MKINRSAKTAAALMASALVLTGCTSNQLPGAAAAKEACAPGAERVRTGVEAPPTVKTGKQLKIGISPTAMDTYYKRVMAGVQEQVDAAGGDSAIHVDIQAPTSQSATDDQVRSVESWISQDYDAIAVALYNESALEPLFKKAAERGIPVFVFNSAIVCSSYIVSDIGYNQADGGRAQAKWIVDHYGTEEKEIAVLEGLPGPHSSERLRGLEDGLKDHPNFKIVARQPAGWTRAGGLSVTENILQAHPNIDILVGFYDEMVLGGREAIRAAGKEGEVSIIGYENVQEANDSIKAGSISATVDTGAKLMGANIVRAAKSYASNGETVPTTVYNDVKLYDKDNIGQFDPKDYVYVPPASK